MRQFLIQAHSNIQKYLRLNYHLYTPLLMIYINEMITKFTTRVIKFSYNSCYLFSSLSRQKALLAMDYVHEIAKQPNFESDQPLMKRILKVKPTSNQVTPYVETELQKMFTQGIKIDQQIFNQQSLKEAIESRTSGLFAFYPTILVTQQLFDIFLRCSKHSCDMMTSGQFGIAKTTTFILYWHLSSMINDYLYDAPEEERKAFLDSFPVVPRKIFYWNIGLGMDHEDIKDLIIKQCPKSLQEDLKQYDTYDSKLSEFCAFIWHKYYERSPKRYGERSFECDIAFDQINCLTSIFKTEKEFRDWKAQEQKYHPEPLEQKRTQPKNICQNLSKAQSAYHHLHDMEQIVGSGSKYYHIQVNTERQYLGRSDSLYRHTLKIQQRNKYKQRIHLELVTYYENLSTRVGQSEIDQIIKRQLIGQFPKSFVPSEAQIEARLKKFHGDEDNYRQWPHYVRPLTIFKSLKKLKQQKGITILDEAPSFIDKTIQLISTFVETLKLKQSSKADQGHSFIDEALLRIESDSKLQIHINMRKFFQKGQYHNSTYYWMRKWELYSSLSSILRRKLQKDQIAGDSKPTVTFDELRNEQSDIFPALQSNGDKLENKDIIKVSDFYKEISLIISAKDFLEFWDQASVQLYELWKQQQLAHKES